MVDEHLPVLLFAMLLAFLAGMLASSLYHNSRLQLLRREHDRLEDELELERRMIAERMAAASREIPHFTYVEEIDLKGAWPCPECARGMGVPPGLIRDQGA